MTGLYLPGEKKSYDFLGFIALFLKILTVQFCKCYTSQKCNSNIYMLETYRLMEDFCEKIEEKKNI